MPDFEKAGFRGQWVPGRRLDGGHGIVFVVKRRFDVDTASARSEPSDATEPVQMVPEYADQENAAESWVVTPGELAFEKPLVDVIVKGTAYAPGGKPTPSFEVGVKIAGVLNRTMRVQGNRIAQYVAPKKLLTRKQLEKGEQQEYPHPTFTDPAPITSLPLTYEYAYGGVGQLILDDFAAELAEDSQEDAALLEERRQRKKEIEEQLLAEEEAAEKKAQEDAKRAKEGGLADAETAKKAGQAFEESGTQMLDADTLEALRVVDDEPEMKKVSEFRLGRDLPDTPEELEDGDESEPSQDGEDENDTSVETGTRVLNLADLPGDGDELKSALDARALQEARKLRDEEGALRVRATEFEDIELSDDEWIKKYGKKLRARKKKKREPSDHPEIPYPANPCGRGFCVSPLKDAVDGLELPNLEWAEDALTPETLVVAMEEFDVSTLRAPAGFTSFPQGWFPRAKHAGVYPWDLDAAEQAKLSALDDYDEDDPADQESIAIIQNQSIPTISELFFQEAHPRLQVERVNGDEEVLLTNLTPDGHLFFRLPGVHPVVTFDRGLGKERVFARLDTLTLDVLDPNKPTVNLVWRGWLPISQMDELGDMSRCDVDIEPIDQIGFFDLAREAEKGAKVANPEVTRAIAAMTEDDVDAPDGVSLEAEYKALIQQRRDGDALGAAKDESGVEIFDQSLERQLSDDSWDDEIRANKDEIEAIVEKQKKAKKTDKKKAIRKKARKKADEDLGIEWVDGDDSEDKA